MPCPNCTSPHCPGPSHLREFEDWNDLASHLSEDQIVEFVNKWVGVVESRRHHGKVYRTRQRTLAKLALEHLDQDEIRELKRKVEREL